MKRKPFEKNRVQRLEEDLQETEKELEAQYNKPNYRSMSYIELKIRFNKAIYERNYDVINAASHEIIRRYFGE